MVTGFLPILLWKYININGRRELFTIYYFENRNAHHNFFKKFFHNFSIVLYYCIFLYYGCTYEVALYQVRLQRPGNLGAEKQFEKFMVVLYELGALIPKMASILSYYV